MAKIKVVDTREQTGFLRLTISSVMICLQLQDIRVGRGCSRRIFSEFICTPCASSFFYFLFFYAPIAKWTIGGGTLLVASAGYLSLRDIKRVPARKTSEHSPRHGVNLHRVRGR